MSSAALQTAPHQHTALTSSPLATPPGRQYKNSPSREAYNAHQATTVNTSSRRPPSRKTSDSAPSPSYHLAPGFGNPGTTSTASPDQQFSTSEHSSNMPPTAPPRTSSNQQSSSARRSNYSQEKMSNSPRRGQTDGSRTGSRGDSTPASNNGHKGRTAVNSHVAQDSTPRSTSSRDGRNNATTIPIRSGQSTPSKQASENLIKAIANSDDPVTRERQHVASQDDDAAPPPVVSSNDQDRRGGRSRHDHSRGHKATSKFGDFILGNTIGEGEFGKVKLGWKQDSSVQVNPHYKLSSLKNTNRDFRLL